MKTLFLLVVLFGWFSLQDLRPQGIIPAENRIAWTPGIPGGIPVITSPVVDVTDYGADNTGVNDSKTAIRNAINSLGSGGGVVYIPAGRYRIVGSLTISKSGIVLRGDGADRTKLFFESPDYQSAAISIVTYDRGEWQECSGYIKDSATITVTDGSGFKAGGFAEIRQENDSAFMYTDNKWDVSWAENSVGQLFEVRAVNGNEITFKTPLHLTYTDSLDPVMRPQGFVVSSGIEDLYIQLNDNSDVHTLLIKNAAYCWVRNVESYYSNRSHVAGESALGCVVRDSYFHRSHNYGGGGHGYGVSLGLHVTDWLIENNIFDSLRHAMLVSVGANGNVFGYNYSQHVLQGEGETGLNEGWIPPDISIHGHYPFMNLFESNSVQEVGINDYWGPAGPGNTYFRNRVRDGESQDGITYYDHAQKQNVLGNSMIALRNPDGTARDNLEHGNTIGGTLYWDPDIPDHDLPASYYLTGKPGFFGSKEWPLYGPVEGYSGSLPAQERLENDTITSVFAGPENGNPELSIYPNPFRQITTITFEASTVNSRIVVYDLPGRLVL